MKLKLTQLLLLLCILAFVGSGCRNTYKRNWYIHGKKRTYTWHKHHFRPRAHHRGYW